MTQVLPGDKLTTGLMHIVLNDLKTLTAEILGVRQGRRTLPARVGIGCENSVQALHVLFIVLYLYIALDCLGLTLSIDTSLSCRPRPLLSQQTAPTMSCPFMSASAGAPQPLDSSDISKCPMHAQILAAHQHQQQDGAAAAPAVCPLGFGSSRGPKLSTLHCPVCKGLLFDAHMSTGCKHTFCHSCLSRTRDCPVCGMDVEGMEPNTELSGMC
jgi:hypothetical protein